MPAPNSSWRRPPGHSNHPQMARHRHLIRCLHNDSARFSPAQKRHLQPESRRWRLLIILIVLAVIALALYGGWREISL